MKKIIVFLLVFMCCLACTYQNKGNDKLMTTRELCKGKTKVIITSVTGTYKGVIPAADCPGIETTLVLNSDNTFENHMSYIDRNVILVENGTYEVKDDLLTLKEKKGNLSYYRIKEYQIRMLNNDKKDVEGNLSEHFVLNKQ